MTDVALWLRVSDPDAQNLQNQRPELEALAKRRDWQVTRVFEVGASAYKGAHLKALGELYDGARRGEYQVVITWALDRLSREGPQATLEIVSRLGKYGCQVVSLQEPWTEVGGELLDLLLAIAGWVARMESTRRSERTKAGLVRARSQGKRLGRPPGAKDTRRRKQSGYFRRWAGKREGEASPVL
ncbi:MAG: recombinase family protein [Chloroflexota bacterium]